MSSFSMRLDWSHWHEPALVSVILFLYSWAFAVPRNASWSGALRDDAGSPVVGATIILTDVSGKATHTAETKVNGEFAFPAIAPSTYSVSAIATGVTYKAAQPVVIAQADTLTANLQLSRLDTTLVLLQEQSAPGSQGSGGEHLSRSEVSSLPLNSRDFSKLLLLAAGTMTDANGAANFTQQFAVNGQRGTTTVFAMDGAHRAFALSSAFVFRELTY